MAKFYVRVASPRPDFRLVMAFVWGDANCDTDGNSGNAASREWTELCAQNRERHDERVDVFPASTEPLVLQVQADHEWLATVVAYLLAETTGGGVSDEPTGLFEPGDSALARGGGFNLGAAWARFHASPFQRATRDDPYPNLRG